nr:ribonuclease H-like domain-containing protein [Tanacetum cinerariifolium]
MTIPFPSRLNDYYCKEKIGLYGSKFLEAYSYEALHIDNFIPRKEKDPGSLTLPCYINNVCFDNALADLGASVNFMPLSAYLNLGSGKLAHSKLTIKLADRTVKYPKGIAENVLVEARLMGETLVLNRSLDPLYGDYIELNDLNVPLELRRDQVDDLMPTIKEGEVIDEPIIDIIKTTNNESLDEASCVEAKRFDGLITIHNGSDNVTYQMTRSNPWFKHLSNDQFNKIKPLLKDQGIFDSGCSRHMTGNKSYIIDYQETDGGFITFEGNAKGGKITGKGKIRTGKLDFEDVYFVKELKFNLFSISQMCDKKNSVLFTNTKCVVLSPDFKLLDESQVLLKVPRNNNMYSFDLKNFVPVGDLTCLFAKATLDESNLWHRRLGHINFKTMNKLVRGNLVRGLPSKLFKNDHTSVTCQKGKQHKASCIKYQMDHKVKTIRRDNGTEFKNRVMNELCEIKAIRREFNVARTPQQNSVA